MRQYYIVFSWPTNRSSGGFNDYDGRCTTYEQAEALATECFESGAGTVQIVRIDIDSLENGFETEERYAETELGDDGNAFVKRSRG